MYTTLSGNTGLYLSVYVIMSKLKSRKEKWLKEQKQMNDQRRTKADEAPKK